MSREIIWRLILLLITASKFWGRVWLLDYHPPFRLCFFFCFVLFIAFSWSAGCCCNGSSILRRVPLDSIDSSLAIGFYCKDKGIKLPAHLFCRIVSIGLWNEPNTIENGPSQISQFLYRIDFFISTCVLTGSPWQVDSINCTLVKKNEALID